MKSCTIAVAFATELSRYRALTDSEADMLAVVTRQEGNTRPMRRVWRRGDDHALEEMLRNGMTAPQIASHMGRTAWSVRSRIRARKAERERRS